MKAVTHAQIVRGHMKPWEAAAQRAAVTLIWVGFTQLLASPVLTYFFIQMKGYDAGAVMLVWAAVESGILAVLGTVLGAIIWLFASD